MNKKIMTIEIIMITYTLLSSPLAGLMTLGYVLTNRKKIKDLEDQLRRIKSEEVKSLILPFIEPTKTASFLHQYKNCLIEDYNNHFFLIMKPSGEKLKKTFLTLQEAKEEIDMVSPFLKEQTYEKRKVHNIRYVR